MAQGIPGILVNSLMAATVLAWSMPPPPVQHCHEGGADSSHRHDCGDQGDLRTDLSSPGHCASDGGQPRSALPTAQGIGGAASHLHFQWLGFRLTLPDDDSPTKKGEDRCPSKLLFVQASRASVPQVCSDKGLDTSLTVLPLNAIAVGVEASYPPSLGSLLRLTPHPLCDRARHERSGVLLA
jgi:hypothetical protein